MKYLAAAFQRPVATSASRSSARTTIEPLWLEWATGHGVARLYADAVVGWRDMPLTTLEWYCAGVGLVRLERDEPARSTCLIGGHVTMELLQWRRN